MIDPFFVRQQIESLKLTHPEIWEADDDVLLLNSLEGQTDLHAFLDALMDRIDDVEEHLPGLAERLSALHARKHRYERQIEGLRALALKLMDAAGARKIELDHATLSVATGQRKVIITDEAALPEYCIRTKREPNKLVIKDRLAHGEHVPGAMLSNAEPFLTVRDK